MPCCYYLLSTLVILASITGCAAKQSRYVKARPIAESAPKPIEPTAALQPPPGQFKPMPDALEMAPQPSGGKKPWKVIDAANQSAARQPEQPGYFNAIMRYDYEEGFLYQVYTAPLKITDIALQSGEKIAGNPACGDTVRWVMGRGTSKKKGAVTEHIYLKPTRPGLHTTLSINTNRRTYHLELHSYITTYMAAVSWRYPHDEFEEKKQLAQKNHEKNQRITASQIQLDQLSFNYEIEIESGDAKAFKPLKVFDDGRKTFIQFPKRMRHAEAPALFILSEQDEVQLVNYRKKNDFYIVDRLFARAELRCGQKNQAIVRIRRKGD